MGKLSEIKNNESLNEVKKSKWDELLATDKKNKDVSNGFDAISMDDFRHTAKSRISELIDENASLKNANSELAAEISKKTITESKRSKMYTDIKECNPNYEEGKRWKINCQRCVPAYELRRRGYEVVSQPKPIIVTTKDLSFHPFDVWKNPDVIKAGKNAKSEIEDKMKEWGDGARVQIVVVWKGTNSGHTFVAEQLNGQTIFMDPQTGKTDVSKYFDFVEPNKIRYCRIDNLDFTEKIKECYKEV